MPAGFRHAVAIEQCRLEELRQTKLYLYELDGANFRLQDEAAGCYVSTETEVPRRVIEVNDIEAELARRGAALITVNNLEALGEEIRRTSFYWSLCRMKYIKKENV